MKLNNINNSHIYSPDFLIKQRSNNTNTLQNVDDIIRNRKEDIITYEGSDAQKKVIGAMKRHDEMKRSLRDAVFTAFKNGEDPIKAAFDKYNENENMIKNSNLTDDEKEEDLRNLEKSFKHNSEWFANRIHGMFFFAGLKVDPSNQMSKIYDGIDRDKLENIRNDIVKMFDNTKDYYSKEGSLKGITTSIIEANTNSITFHDSKKLYSVIKDVRKVQESLNEKIKYERTFGNGIDKEEHRLLSNYIREKANGLNVNSFTKGLYLDLFF